MRCQSLIVLFLLLTLSGCNLPEDEWGVVRVIWNDFPWWSVVWRLTLWSFLGTVVGFFVGVSISLLLRRYGAYRLPWPRVRFWLTLAVVILNILVMPLLFGTIGFFEGMYHSSEVAVRRSVIGKEWLPKIAESGADAVCFCECLIEKEDLVDWDEVHQKKRPVNVPRMLNGLDRLKEGAAAIISAKAKAKLFEENPDWQGGATETVIDWTLPPLVNYLLNRKLQGKLKEYGVPDFLEEMRAEACKDGDDLLTHAELTFFLTDRVLIPMVLYPLRQWVKSTQTTMLAIAAAVFAGPVLLMGLTRWITFWWKRRKVRRMCVDRL